MLVHVCNQNLKCLLLNQYIYCQIHFKEIHFDHSNCFLTVAKRSSELLSQPYLNIITYM